MPRAKNRVASRKRRKKILKANAGYYGKRKNCISIASAAFFRAGQYAFRDRRAKKRDFRALWIMRINAAARVNGLTYGKFIAGCKAKGIALNRKTLAYLAVHEPAAFTRIAQTIKS